MHIVFGVERYVKVEHCRHVFDVQTTRSHIGTHQQVHLAAFESFQRFQTLVLALVAVQGGGAQAIALEGAGQAGAAEFAVAKHKGLGDAIAFDQLLERAIFVVHTHAEEMLRHGGRGLVGARHFDGDGVLQVAAGQALDLGREGGREQQRGALLGQVAQDALQVGQETNVQHAVGFVEHHIFHLVEHHVLGFDVVKQTTGRGHQHLDAFFQLQGLGFHVHATKHHRAAQIAVFGVGLDLLGHLVGQLARGQQHQGAHGMSCWRGGGVFVLEQALQQGQRESRSFTRAGLGRAHHVLARQNHRNGLGLDGGHGFVAHFGYGACQRGGQLQIGKRGRHVRG